MRKRVQRLGCLLLGTCLLLTVGCSKTDTTSTSLSEGDHSGVYGEANTVAAYDTTNTNYALNIDAGETLHDISDMLYGIFIEDINFAADGGLYAEMVQNRSFEFTDLAKGDAFHAWSNVGDIEATVIADDTEGCLNDNNPSYVKLVNASGAEAGIANSGFLDGMSIEENADYNMSLYARSTTGYTGSLTVALTNDGEVVGEAEITGITDTWAKYQVTLTSSVTSYSKVKLQVTMADGEVDLDMISLFPAETYQGRENGLRVDLAEKLEALEPSFLRFPGGCVVEGVSLTYAYDWKDSIGCDADGNPYEWNGTYGDVAARKQGQNIWTNESTTSDEYPSYMTYGLGFYEYFLLAEDIGAVGVPVLNCGLCCMGQSNGSGTAVGTEDFEAYIQDALDLVEFCRGDETTTWGAVRIAMGHEDPFELKYIGIGNEQWGDNFFAHYEAFVDAFAQAAEENPEMYGDIELMFTAGVDDGDSGASMYMAAYEEAAEWLSEHPDATIDDFAGAIDHHYYNSPDWFLAHNDYYDESNYSRSTEDMTSSTYGGGINVFLGEYAAQSNNWYAALSEASYMTGLERNGDIVKMAAYAPLFGNLTATHWAPDLIWFNNHTSTCSVNYYVQQIFAQNAGTALYASTLEGAEVTSDTTLSGMVGVGTWNTAATFDNVLVTSNEDDSVLASDDFSTDDFASNWTKVSDGTWSVEDGALVQSSTTTNTNSYSTTGTAAYFGDNTWTDYTFTVDATKTAGDEGFLISFAVGDKNNNFFWNIGGWSNTVSCLQQVTNGTKSGQVSGTVKNCAIKTGQTYSLKVVVSGDNVKCYIDDKLYVDYTLTANTTAESYQVVSTDESGDIIIKLVNVTSANKTFAIHIDGVDSFLTDATVYQLVGDSLADDNILGQEEVVSMDAFNVSGLSEAFNYTVPQYSVTVIRIPTE